MTLRAALLALSATVVTGTTLWSAGQSQAPSAADAREQAYLSRATAILVDVVVRDRQGRPVLDLKADDFELSEDQVPQQIGSFTLVSRGSGLGIGVRVKKDRPDHRRDADRHLGQGGGRRQPATPVVAMVFDALSPKDCASASVRP